MNNNVQEVKQRRREVIERAKRRIDPTLSFAGAVGRHYTRREVNINSRQTDYLRDSDNNERRQTLESQEQTRPWWAIKMQEDTISALTIQNNKTQAQVDKNTENIQKIMDKLIID